MLVRVIQKEDETYAYIISTAIIMKIIRWRTSPKYLKNIIQPLHTKK